MPTYTYTRAVLSNIAKLSEIYKKLSSENKDNIIPTVQLQVCHNYYLNQLLYKATTFHQNLMLIEILS